MYKYAIIENKKVVNTVMSDHDYAAEQGWISCLEKAGIGFDYVNGEFIDNRPQPEVVSELKPTKEQLMAELAALTSKIQALE